MTRCDVYVQLSKYEAEPVTVQEVAVFGKPMVLSSIEGFYRYSMIFKNIVLVEIEPKRIAEAIATNSKNMTDNRVELEKIEESTLGKIRLMLD